MLYCNPLATSRRYLLSEWHNQTSLHERKEFKTEVSVSEAYKKEK